MGRALSLVKRTQPSAQTLSVHLFLDVDPIVPLAKAALGPLLSVPEGSPCQVQGPLALVGHQSAEDHEAQSAQV